MSALLKINFHLFVRKKKIVPRVQLEKYTNGKQKTKIEKGKRTLEKIPVCFRTWKIIEFGSVWRFRRMKRLKEEKNSHYFLRRETKGGGICRNFSIWEMRNTCINKCMWKTHRVFERNPRNRKQFVYVKILL